MNSAPQACASASPVRRQWLSLILGLLVPLFCFGVLTETVWNRNGLAWDVAALNCIHQFATPLRDSAMVWVTRMGDVRTVMALTAAMVVVLARKQKRRDALFLAAGVAGALLLDDAIKNAVHRVRPHLWKSPAPEFDFSFPSGHSTGTMALVAALVVIAWRTRWRWQAIICGGIHVAAVGFSRLYLGVHYPSDVMGGWLLGFVWICALTLLCSAEHTGGRPWKVAAFAAGIPACLVACLGGYIFSDLKHDNLRTVMPAEAYRSGLMSADALTDYIRRFGIKSILNLRGASPDREWYRDEIEAARKLNVAHYDFGLSARQELTRAEMTSLEKLLQDAPKPVLIHCAGGADRSALASAIYLYAVAGKSPAAAERELSPWNGHLPIFWPKVIAMDTSFRHYVSNHISEVNAASAVPKERASSTGQTP